MTRLSILAMLFAATSIAARRPTLATGVRQYVSIDTSVVALTHVRVIDGTGAPARADQTIIIRDGRLASVGRHEGDGRRDHRAAVRAGESARDARATGEG